MWNFGVKVEITSPWEQIEWMKNQTVSPKNKNVCLLSPCPSPHNRAYQTFRQGLSCRDHRTSTSTAARSRARWFMQVFIFFVLTCHVLAFMSNNQVRLSMWYRGDRGIDLCYLGKLPPALWQARFLCTISCEWRIHFQAECCNCLGSLGHVCPRPFSCYLFFMFISHNHASASTCDTQRWDEMRPDKHRQTDTKIDRKIDRQIDQSIDR